MLTVHCGILPWHLDEFYYPYYKNCISELGIKFNYDSICHLLGNSYAENAGEAISESNPFNIKSEKEKIASAPKPTLDMMKNLGLLK